MSGLDIETSLEHFDKYEFTMLVVKYFWLAELKDMY